MNKEKGNREDRREKKGKENGKQKGREEGRKQAEETKLQNCIDSSCSFLGGCKTFQEAPFHSCVTHTKEVHVGLDDTRITPHSKRCQLLVNFAFRQNFPLRWTPPYK